MSKLWITEEEVSNKFLTDKLEHPIILYGALHTAYCICADSKNYKDYVEANKDFLLKFLHHQQKYPLFVTFMMYDETDEEFQDFLNENNIEFRRNHIEEKDTYYHLSIFKFKKADYHPPCFTVIIKDVKELTLVLVETFDLAFQNLFYAISFSDNLTFETKEVTEKKKKKKKTTPTFEIEDETTFITLLHDAQGFFLMTNEMKYSTVTKLMETLPEGTTVTQINDMLIGEDEE